MGIIVECDNCGENYVVFENDRNRSPYCHGVCITCFLPMNVKNPFYKEKK